MFIYLLLNNITQWLSTAIDGSGIRWMSTVSGGSGIRWMSTVRGLQKHKLNK